MVSSALPQQQTVSEGTGNSERTFEDTSPQKQQQGESSGGWKNSEKQNEEISQNVMDASSPALSGTASASGLQREEVDPECIEQHRPASEPSSQRPLEARDSNETMISNAANFQRNMGSRSEARQNVNSGDFESATDAVQKDVATKQDHRLCEKDAPDHGFASKLVDDVSQNEEIQKSTSRLNDESENTLVSSPTQKNEPTSSALDASSIQATQAKIPFSATGLVDNMQTSDTSVLNPNSSTSPVDHDDDAKSSEKRQDSLVQKKQEGECQEGMDDDTSSNQEPVDIGFSQLMTQDPGGFLYTQMSQGEADNSVALPLAETVEPLQAYSKPTATASILQEIEATTFECLLPETAGKDDIDDTLHEMKRADLSNKCSHVSSQQLSLTKVMHPPSLDEKTRKDENARIPVPPLGNVVLMTQNRGMSRLPPSFMSAGNGNVVSVTAESLARASALVHSTTAEKQATQTDSTVKSSSDSTMQPIIMFQTARKGIAISVSNDSPARAITDEKKDEKTLHANEPLPSAKMQNFSAIFQTAGKGMKISVTDDSLKMANTLFQESAADGMNVAKASPANTPEAEQSQSNSGDENIVKSNFSSLLANTTISRKNCREAEAAIQRQDRQPTSLQTHAPLSMASFQTAGTGSFISVSENSLAKAETLFHGSTATVGSEATMFSPKPPRPMFRTVRESLKHAVTSLQDMVEDSSGAGSERSSSQDRISDSHNPLPAMFQTAGRRSSITVSVEDMARANAILRDKSDRAQSAQKYQAKAIRTEATASSRFPPSAPLIQNADNGSLVPVSCSASVGDPSAPAGFVTPFQTAGKGHAISVSDASLEKANFVLEEKRVLDPHVEPTAVPKCGNHPRTSLSPALSQSQIAGTMSDRSMTGATALLEGMQTTKHVVFGQKPSPRKLASLSCCVSGFKTAGQDNAIAVSKESLTQASALVQGESLGMVEPPGVALSPAFRSAGKGEAIAVTGESLRNASNLFEERMSGEVDTEDHTVVVENKTRSFTGQASHAPVFQTAGKKSSIRVPEDVLDRATALLDKNWAQIGASAKKSVRETSEDHAIPVFRTAAMSSAISVSEKIVSKATAKLAETNDHAAVGEERNDLIPNGESETLKEETSLSESNESCVTATMVRTAGKGSAIAVSAEFVARANDILQGMSTCDDKGGDKESLEGACSVMPTTSIPRAPAFMGSTPQSVALDSFETSSDLLPELAEAINEAGETSEDGTKNLRAPGKENLSCNTLDAVPDQLSSQKDACCNAQSSHASVAEISERRCYMLQDDHGLATQPLPPETPLLCSRHAQPEKYGQEDSLRIRTVAFGLTPQSQSIDRKEPRSGAARILPLNHSNDHERSTERITFPAVTPSNWVEREQRQEPPVSTRKLPAFTPKQESTESNTIVTMSFDPKNPYTRKLHDSSSNTFGEKGKLSPVPINFRHLEGSFRGEALSPSAIAYAQNVLAGERASLSNQVDQSQPTAGRPNVVKTPVGDTKKMVTWSKHDKRNAALTSGQRISLSAFASKYGGMDDSVDVCRDAGVHSVTIAVDSNNATRVRFYPDSGLPCSFFGQPSPPQCKPIGSVKDIRMSLIDRGCDEDKLSDKWISNHCRWIVWKLASTERRFSFSLSQSYLTYEHLITQLQQRFEKEIKGGCRSALRKVLNQDVAANSLMILCISQIVRQNKSKEYTETGKTRCDYILELTDGWYSIGGVLDSSLSALVSAGKIQVGSKLLTCNAKLEGPDDGVDPLDSSYLSSGRNYSAALCLIGNGTRLAKWDAKMGFVSSIHGSLLVRKISDIVPGGGNVPLIDLVVCRIYPRMFLERQGACSSNESPVISEAMEYKNRMNFDKKRLLAMERLSETVQNECIKVRD
jgi:breast cancer 2 susceptibility protein